MTDKDAKAKALETAEVAGAQAHKDCCLQLWPLGRLGFILSESGPEPAACFHRPSAADLVQTRKEGRGRPGSRASQGAQVGAEARAQPSRCSSLVDHTEICLCPLFLLFWWRGGGQPALQWLQGQSRSRKWGESQWWAKAPMTRPTMLCRAGQVHSFSESICEAALGDVHLLLVA